MRDACAAWETVRDRILRFRQSLSETERKGNVFQKKMLAAGSAGRRLIWGKKSAWKRGKPGAAEKDGPTPDIPPDPTALQAGDKHHLPLFAGSQEQSCRTKAHVAVLKKRSYFGDS